MSSSSSSSGPANPQNDAASTVSDSDDDENMLVSVAFLSMQQKHARLQKDALLEPLRHHGKPSQVGAHNLVKAFGLCPGNPGCKVKVPAGKLCPLCCVNRLLPENIIRADECCHSQYHDHYSIVHTTDLWHCATCEQQLCSTCMTALEAEEENAAGAANTCRSVRRITLNQADGSKRVEKVWLCEECASEQQYRGLKTSDVEQEYKAPAAGEREKTGPEMKKVFRERLSAEAAAAGMPATAKKKKKLPKQVREIHKVRRPRCSYLVVVL